MNGLNEPKQGEALREWGVKVSSRPITVSFGELPPEPIYFSPKVEEHFQQLKLSGNYPRARVCFVFGS